MKNPFGKDGGPANSVGRNTFDLSFQNNLTTQFGALTPVVCKEVLPGDSFKIDTTFGLRFMPTAFPLQTRIRADVHFFYVRNRNLWKDWMDFYGKTKDSSKFSFPYISPKGFTKFGVGELSDYLGVPTSVYGNNTQFDDASFSNVVSNQFYGDSSSSLTYNNAPSFVGSSLSSLGSNSNGGSSCLVFLGLSDSPDEFLQAYSGQSFRVSFQLGTVPADVSALSSRYRLLLRDSRHNVIACLDSTSVRYELNSYFVSFVYGGDSTLDFYSAVLVPEFTTKSYVSVTQNQSQFYSFSFASVLSFLDYGDLTNKPYGNWIHLSALPFRAYESIYNSFYRDPRNNPFIVDGEKEFNKYLLSTDGGEDTNYYPLRFRNWEQDFLTTAVPTPQQGNAPLVGLTGISATGLMTLTDSESGKSYQVQAQTADDADTIVGYSVTENLPQSVSRALVNYATSGISINDFRNVNAFQRWLETNIRRGFKYRDQIKSHYDVDVAFDVLDMPEFIGGVSCDVSPQTVSQTSQDSLDNPLGSYAGQLYGSGSSKHSVSKYFDEHGFIIGILSVVPVPNYSQVLPKYFLKTTDSLDYFTPEFGHIGLQAIPVSEVSPLTTDSNTFNDIFGYQRAWYDYLQSIDEVHGQFRSTLRDFVMNRVFDNTPVLGPSFTVIDPRQLNDVFTVREVDGKPVHPILGQIYFDIKAKRPIPKYGVPKLE